MYRSRIKRRYTKGWQRNFVPKKFRGRKWSFRGIPRFTEESIPKLGTTWNYMKKSVLQKSCSSNQNWPYVFVREMLRKKWKSESWLLFLFHRTEFREFASIFVPWKGISNCFLFCRMIQNGIPRVCSYFCSTVQISKHFSPLQNGSERNSESFLFRETARIPQEQTNCSINSNNFLSEIANPRSYTYSSGNFWTVPLSLCVGHLGTGSTLEEGTVRGGIAGHALVAGRRPTRVQLAETPIALGGTKGPSPQSLTLRINNE